MNATAWATVVAAFIGGWMGAVGITPRDLWDVACYLWARVRGKA